MKYPKEAPLFSYGSRDQWLVEGMGIDVRNGRTAIEGRYVEIDGDGSPSGYWDIRWFEQKRGTYSCARPLTPAARAMLEIAKAAGK